MTVLARAACLALLVCLLPAVQAGPLPNVDDLPIVPQEAEALVDPVQKILKDLYPEEAPFASECLKTDSGTYDPEEEPEDIVTVDQAHGFVVVTVWFDGTYHEVKIDSGCLDD